MVWENILDFQSWWVLLLGVKGWKQHRLCFFTLSKLWFLLGRHWLCFEEEEVVEKFVKVLKKKGELLIWKSAKEKRWMVLIYMKGYWTVFYGMREVEYFFSGTHARWSFALWTVLKVPKLRLFIIANGEIYRHPYYD